MQNGDVDMRDSTNGNNGDLHDDHDAMTDVAERTNDIVAILDAGAQYGKVIDRRVRELKIQTEILPLNTPVSDLINKRVKAVIVSGGPGSVYDEGAPEWDREIIHSGLPILGICYGMQLLNRDCGGNVEKSETRKDGQFMATVDCSSPLYKQLPAEQNVLLTHQDKCVKLAPGFKVTAKCSDTIVGIENADKKLFGVQYHPEVDLSEFGKQIISNFLFNVAGMEPNFTLESRKAACIKEIREFVGEDKKVLSLVSGGVDSSVCTALLHEAISSDRVIAIHIDNGFLRLDESEQVRASLEAIGLKIKVVHAAHDFSHGSTTVPSQRAAGEGATMTTVNVRVGPLHSVISPEDKRKIIGDMFMKVVEDVTKELNLDQETTILAQGTLRPDLIESASSIASGNAEVIKTHHNDSQLVRALRSQGKVIEPLRDFHKDEVRALGRELNLPDALIERHPFPGPGLAIRVLCAEEKFSGNDFLETSNLLNIIVDYHRALSKPHPLLARIQDKLPAEDVEALKEISSKWAVGCTLLPIRTVGVQGDCRTYSYVAAISSDENPNWEIAMQYAKIIPKLCVNINRVVYTFGGRIKHPVSEITPTCLTENVVKKLRQVDHAANQVLVNTPFVRTITQMPVILIPVHFDLDPVARVPPCQRSVVIRTFITNDFMTGVAAQPGKHLDEKVVFDMVAKIKEVPGISRVLYDLTSKPPGTTEWE